MANILDDTLGYIATQLGVSWAKGTNLFYPRFPKVTNVGIAVGGAGSGDNNRYVDQYYPNLTISSRDADIDTAYTNWQSVAALFRRNENISTTNFIIMMAYGLTDVPILTLDGPRLWEWEGSFSFRYRAK